ncbi:hypothetical protein AVEN_162264-1 [Araneus ventricosus]|uniref:Uncharacterized protein n=1 Tax=Araneus ventricosus TaxID=182803 RepID=A0A4Y2M9R2_ARAVE|nr:hypothetical protein AVEN_162264-1 [Araneus ventricosus]
MYTYFPNLQTPAVEKSWSRLSSQNPVLDPDLSGSHFRYATSSSSTSFFKVSSSNLDLQVRPENLEIFAEQNRFHESKKFRIARALLPSGMTILSKNCQDQEFILLTDSTAECLAQTDRTSCFANTSEVRDHLSESLGSDYPG